MPFSQFNLHTSILKAIHEAGYVNPTPIQTQAIPEILKGHDLLASAQTGSGKTAAFLLPALHKLSTSSVKGTGPRVLILVPTRELAMQVANVASMAGQFLSKMKTVCIFGGAPYPVQIRQLANPHEILVATPGRLIDHIERGRVNLSRVEMFILDEADRMLDMGFYEPVNKIAALLPKQRQTLLFSATLKGAVLKLSKSLLTNPLELSVKASLEQKANIEQRLHYTDGLTHKHQLLDHFLSDPTLNQAIVFTSTKRSADLLADEMKDRGYRTAALHGDMNQRQRTRTMAQLRQGEIRVLVATDVAARGIDVQTITHVINFDIPQCAEDYVHRIGRTGRAGSKGLALSFAQAKDNQLIKQIEQFTGEKLTSHVVEGLEPKMKPRQGYASIKGSSRFKNKPYNKQRKHPFSSAASENLELQMHTQSSCSELSYNKPFIKKQPYKKAPTPPIFSNQLDTKKKHGFPVAKEVESKIKTPELGPKQPSKTFFENEKFSFKKAKPPHYLSKKHKVARKAKNKAT